ncbi:MAG: PAS domain S-box protein, partial [Cyclobacteriaceae bacterium]
MPQKSTKSLINIIAVGASAGGLEAIQDFLSHLPALENTCIIIAQHLSPTNKSMLVELLGRKTNLIVYEAISGKTLQANKVYVTPPNSEITVSKGKIFLQKPVSDKGPKPSVDTLFYSLANLANHNIVGIILSGTGSDGALGLKSLNVSGAYILVQDPETAKYDGMPLAAIHTGVVDSVLAPKAMGAAILAFLSDPKLFRQTAISTEEDASPLGKIMNLLSRQTGTDFSNYKSSTIQRRLEKRMSMLKIQSIEEYINVIEKDLNEAEQLFNILLIGVTQFFRDMEAFAGLEHCLKQIVNSKAKGEAIRIWVPGCSSGEEAYSIAILLSNFLQDKAQHIKIQIFATDIDERGIAIGRRGIYSAKSLENVPVDMLKSFFIKTEEGFELVKSIRSMVIFSKHDVTRNPPFLQLDLISCRNLLIYFNTTLQEKVLPTFHYALNPEAYLFLGASETVSGFGEIFSIIDGKNKIYQRKKDSISQPFNFSSFTKKQRKYVPKDVKTEALNLSEIVKETLFKTYEHPYVVVNEKFEVLEIHGELRLLTTVDMENSPVNLFKMINQELASEVRTVLTNSIKKRIGVKSQIKKLEYLGKQLFIKIHARPLLSIQKSQDLYVIIFENMDGNAFIIPKEPTSNQSIAECRILELEHELAATREHLQTYIQEIETSNEELQSLNEELQSTNEELETANEELQSTNEEIQITYAELKAVNESLEQKEQQLMLTQANTQALLNNDLQAFVLVDIAYNIMEFNTRALEIFRQLKGRDIKKNESIVDLIPEKQLDSFVADFETVIQGKSYKGEKLLNDAKGEQRWYAVNYTPVIFEKGKVTGISLGLLDITDLKLALTSLNASERLVNAVFNTVSNGICITNKDGIFVDVNDAYCQIYGCSREELIGQSFTIMVPRDMQANLKKVHNNFIRSQKALPEEMEFVSKSGKTKFVKISAELLKLSDGNPYMVTSITDITELKQSENIRLETDRRFQLLFDHVTNLSVQGYASDGTVKYWNEASEKLYGYSREEVVGKKLWDLIIPEAMRDTVKEAVNNMIASGQGHPAEELKLQRKDGTLIPVFSNHTVIQLPGRDPEMFCIDVDLSDQKKSSEALVKSEQELRKIMASSLDVICTIDQKGNFVKVSAAAEKLWYYEPHELQGQNLIDFIYELDKDRTVEILNEVIQGAATINFENRVIRKNGSEVPVIWSMHWDESDQMMFCIARDATSIKESEALIRESESLMNEAQKVAKIGNWNFDFRTDKLTWSESLYDVFGANKETFLQTHGSFVNLVDPEDRARVFQTSERSKKTGDPFTIQYNITTPEGERRVIEEYGFSEKDKKGKVVRLFGTAQDITERKSNELQLLNKEKKFRLLVENAADAIVIVGLEGKTSYVSPSVTNILGYSEEEAMKLNLFEVIHPEDLEDVLKKMEEILQKPGIPVRGVSSRTKHKDGSWRWLDATLTNMVHDPEINGIIDNFRDITEREETFRALQASEARYRGLYESQTNYVIRTDMQNHYTYINKKYEDDFAWLYPGGKLIGQNCFISFLGYDHQKIKYVIEKCIASPGTVQKVEIDKPMLNGDTMSTIWDFVCIADEQGAPKEIQCIGIDISERIKFERALIESNERYEYVNMATRDAIYDWDVEKDVFYWGDGFYRNFGHPKGEKVFTLNDWSDLTHPTDRDNHQSRWNEFLTNVKESRWINSFRFQCVDGSYAYVEEIGYLIRGKTGKPKRMIGAIRDITETKQLEAQEQIQQNIARIFKKDEKLTKILNEVLHYLTDYGSYSLAEVWLASTDKIHLNKVSSYANDDIAKIFYKESKNLNRVLIGESIMGAVWQNHTTEIWSDVGKSTNFLRKDAAKKAGLHSIIGLPLSHNAKLVGVLFLGCEKPIDKQESIALLLKPLEHFLGAEIARKQQEEELHMLFHSAPEILAIASPHGYFSKVNPAFCDLLEYTSEEITSQPFSTFVHPDDQNSTNEEYAKTISGERHANNFINRYITKSGDYRWISWYSSDIFDEDGQVFAFGRDITEVKELQQLFEKTAKLANIGSWRVNLNEPENAQVYWSPMTKEILEVDQNYNPTLTGGFEFYEDGSKAQVKKAINNLIATGENFDLELLLTTAKGKPKWIRCIGQSDRIDGKCIKIYGSFQDIHNRKTTELELIKFKKVIENSVDGIAMADNKLNTIYLNPGFIDMVGYTPEAMDANGGPTSVFANQKLAKTIFETLLAGKYWKGDIEVINAQGDLNTFFLSGGPIFDEAGNLMAIYGIQTDITERINNEKKLQQAFEEKNSILESIDDGFFA